MKKVMRTAGMGRRGPLPVKRSKIADWVRRAIAVGEYAAGERLPDRSWFQAKFGANPTSVQCAFNKLKEDGLVRSVSGHGTSVADPLPFAGRYLLLLKGEQRDGGSRFFSAALAAAAKQIARRRKVCFEIRSLVEAGVDSVEYAEMLSQVRRQRYAGVFAQGASYNRDLDTVTNVDNVPIALFEARSVLAQGSQVVAMEGIRDFNERALRCHLEDLRARGCRKIAIFYPRGVRSADAESVLPDVREAGLELVSEGFHTTDITLWDERQFRRLVRLFLSSDGGKAADGVILGDENFLLPFAAACRELLGDGADGRYAVSSHCNFPLLPKCDFPTGFHGVDCLAMLESFVEYVDARRRAVRRPPLPRVVIR